MSRSRQLEAVAEASTALRAARAAYGRAMTQARKAGATLDEIGRAAGISRQAVHKATAGTADHKRPRPATRQTGSQGLAAARLTTPAATEDNSNAPLTTAATGSAPHNGHARPQEAPGRDASRAHNTAVGGGVAR